MFRTIADLVPTDRDYPERTRALDLRLRILEGTFYDHLPHPFHAEKSPSGEYVPLLQRRPAVRYNLARLVVDDAIALLFGDGHFPEIECESEAARETLAAIIAETGLNATLIHAATRGSVGSVALRLRILKGRVFVDALDTPYLTPFWDPLAPDTLVCVREQYKCTGRSLRDAGYAIPDDELKTDWWYRREWTATQELYYLPWMVRDTKAPEEDKKRTVTHDLGFVPIVWVRNLPGGNGIDGACTFDSAIDLQIEIDYQLSQLGRGLRYSQDPTLMIKEPAARDGHTGGAANALIVSQDGDAKLLEINGTASSAVLDYVRALREYALEVLHGNRAAADKISAAQSGRAMELLNQALIWLADRLRVSYGEGALKQLLGMIQRASLRYPLIVQGVRVEPMDKSPITLRWPAWYAPTAQDRAAIASTLKTHTDAGHMSHETAVKTIAADYDIEDVAAEMQRIAGDQEARRSELDPKTTEIIDA